MSEGGERELPMTVVLGTVKMLSQGCSASKWHKTEGNVIVTLVVQAQAQPSTGLYRYYSSQITITFSTTECSRASG